MQQRRHRLNLAAAIGQHATADAEEVGNVGDAAALADLVAVEHRGVDQGFVEVRREGCGGHEFSGFIVRSHRNIDPGATQAKYRRSCARARDVQ